VNETAELTRGNPNNVACSPSGCRNEWMESERGEAQAELEPKPGRMSTATTTLKPNFKGAILHRDVVGAWEMEHE